MSTSDAAAAGNAAAVCLSEEYNSGPAFWLYMRDFLTAYACTHSLQDAMNIEAVHKLALEDWNNHMTTFEDARPYLELAAELKPQYANGDDAAVFYLFLDRFKKNCTGQGPAMMYRLLASILWGYILSSTDEEHLAARKYYVELAGLLKLNYENPSCCQMIGIPGRVCTCYWA